MVDLIHRIRSGTTTDRDVVQFFWWLTIAFACGGIIATLVQIR